MSDEGLDQPDHGGYELVMPFVTVASAGGPHDDESYTCGWRMGTLDAECRIAAAVGAVPSSRTIASADLRQADLIAMRHGFALEQCEVGEDFDGWVCVDFRAVEAAP